MPSRTSLTHTLRSRVLGQFGDADEDVVHFSSVQNTSALHEALRGFGLEIMEVRVSEDLDHSCEVTLRCLSQGPFQFHFEPQPAQPATKKEKTPPKPKRSWIKRQLDSEGEKGLICAHCNNEFDGEAFGTDPKNPCCSEECAELELQRLEALDAKYDDWD